MEEQEDHYEFVAVTNQTYFSVFVVIIIVVVVEKDSLFIGIYKLKK